MIKYLTQSAGAVALAIAIAGLAMLTGQDAQAQSQYFVPCATVTVVNPAPGAASDIQNSFGIGVGDNCINEPATDNRDMYNFGGVVGFTPREFGVKADADVADGTEMGSLIAQSTLGLLNNPCTNQLLVSFKFYEATIDRTNTIDPLPPGTSDRMKPIGEGVPPAGSLKWPAYLTELFTENGANLDQMHSRYLGVAKVAAANNLTVILNFMVFEPGADISDEINVDRRLGYPSVTVLQDPTATASASDFINDFCSPLLTQTTITSVVRTNPAADGVYNFSTFVVSAFDSDNDGYENALDTCPLVPNQGNSRQQPDTGDSGDRDGIDAACDPDPNSGKGTSAVGIANSDEDGDLWMNRGDNCSIVANPDQEDNDSDGIGNACDPNPDTDDGQRVAACLVAPVTIGAGGAAGVDPLTVQPCNPEAPLDADPQDGSTATPTLAPGQTAAPTPTLAPGQTARPSSGTGGVGGTGSGPAAGIGSLAPVGSGIPDWAVLMAAVGFVGLLGGVTLVGARAGKRQ